MIGPAKAKLFVVSCIDPRFRTALQRFVERRFSVTAEHYDLRTDAGGVREIAIRSEAGEWILRNLDIAVHKHGVDQVVLCNHMDCSYYGGAAPFKGTRDQVEAHGRDLTEAAELIRRRHPGLKVHAFVVGKQDGRFVFESIAVEEA